MNQLRTEIAALQPRVREWRRHLHRHPELSHREIETTKYIIKVLEDIGGFRLRHFADTGIVADIVGGREGKTVALRADIDALPVQEETGLEFASVNEGLMHACGHDAHTAMLLGIAAWLAAHREELPGRYRLLFQAAEEVAESGAQELVDEGALKGVDYIIGQHIKPELATGQLAALDGPTMAAVADYYIDIIGRGGHASQPQDCIDPIPIAAAIVQQLQFIVARRTDPLEALVVSNTVFHAGEVVNAIPRVAHLEGTVRTFDDALRMRTLELIRDIAIETAELYGARAEVELKIGHAATINTPEVAQLVREVVRESWGEEALVDVRPMLAGEDFSAYLNEVPGVFFYLGTTKPGTEVRSLHHAALTVDEDAMPYGMETMIRTALRLAAK